MSATETTRGPGGEATAHKMFLFSSPDNQRHNNKNRRRTPPKKCHQRHKPTQRKPAFVYLLALTVLAPHSRAQVQPEPQAAGFFRSQPLAFAAAMSHEPGSGEGLYTPQLPAHLSLESVSQPGPSLITAKCWNNYEGDSDCKQINLITGNSDSSRPSTGEDDGSLITPVVIFESSSTLDSPNPRPQHSPDLGPPYFSPGGRPAEGGVLLARHRTPPTANDVYAAPPAGATLLSHPALEEGAPATRPSTSIFVATPQPKKGTAGAGTTAGRKCRDENDADCDEPDDDDDDNEPAKSTTPEADDRDDNSIDDDRPRGTDRGGVTYTAKVGTAESGSGNGPDDDNEDDGDDDTDGDPQGSGFSEPPTGQRTTTLVDVASPEYNPYSAQPDTSTTSRPKAEIEVVVHPTLPPTFPVTTTPSEGDDGFTTPPTISTITTTVKSHEQPTALVTNMPDDTITSKPVFPSTSPPSADGGTSSPTDRAEDVGASDNPTSYDKYSSTSGFSTASSTEDLATFRPIPMPPAQARPLDLQSRGRAGGNQSRTDNNDDSIDDKYKFAPPTSEAPLVGKFEHNPWNAMPVKSISQLDQQIQQRQQVRPRKPDLGAARVEPLAPRMQTEVLPTLLLYASIVILTVTALIFVLMAFVFYRRNNTRKRALMAHKANMMNGLPVSMSNHLVANMQQPGLLTTYAPSKGLSNLNRVTTSVIKSEDQLVDDDEARAFSMDNDKTIDKQQGRLNQTTSSWSTEDPSTSNGSSKTADSQQALQNIADGQVRVQYPNSLSDGRQNSSSLSDSQGSPEASHLARPEAPAQHSVQHQQQFRQPQQPTQPQQYDYRPADPNYPPAGLNHQQPDYNFQPQPGQPYPVIAPSVKRFISSRSVENINHDELFIDSYHQHQPPYVQAPQQANHHQPFYNGYPPAQTEGAPYPINEYRQFSQPASPGRLALNPVATLGRRFQPGMGLNRNIYSEDSSSVITASPSLARTSSSLSFAFSSSQQPPPIRPKPLIDPAGRMLNDYNRSNFPTNGAPPVCGPKGQSEAWYV